MTSTTTALHSTDLSGLYERGDVVGTGGIGTVYHATQKRLGREVALKEIRDIFHLFANVRRDDIVERFGEIVRTQARLAHPGIIQVVDVEVSTTYPFVVTQWAPGGNIRRLIETPERPPLAVALRYFTQILYALAFAHDHDVLHGALKPENVVLDASGNALLTDFGLGGLVEPASGVAGGFYVGTGPVVYKAPEQLRDPSLVSRRSDIYSLGIILYELLTGKLPGRRSPMPSSFFPDIPRKLDDIFDRMSIDTPEERYESVHEIIADLFSSEEIVGLLGTPGGALFLHDPLSTDAPAAPTPVAAKPVAPAPPMPQITAPPSAPALVSAEVAAIEQHLMEPTPLEEASSTSSPAEVNALDEAADADADDVLDKLDKYGALFDADDADADEEAPADEAPAIVDAEDEEALALDGLDDADSEVDEAPAGAIEDASGEGEGEGEDEDDLLSKLNKYGSEF